MIVLSVRRAPTTLGGRKIGTPLLTASTPVIAVQPLLNACKSSTIEAARGAVADAMGEMGAAAAPCASTRNVPKPIISSEQATNSHVGNENASPVDRTPRRLISVSSASTAKHSGSVYGSSFGTADTSAPTPAAIATE